MSLSHIRLPPCSRLPAERGSGVCEYVRTRVRLLVYGLPRERKLEHVAQPVRIRALTEINESSRISTLVDPGESRAITKPLNQLFVF